MTKKLPTRFSKSETTGWALAFDDPDKNWVLISDDTSEHGIFIRFTFRLLRNFHGAAFLEDFFMKDRLRGCLRPTLSLCSPDASSSVSVFLANAGTSLSS